MGQKFEAASEVRAGFVVMEAVLMQLHFLPAHVTNASEGRHGISEIGQW